MRACDGDSARAAGERWEQFAQSNPYQYILTALKSTDPAGFWSSGEQTVEREVLPLLQRYAVRLGIALELGCGIGRLVVPLAPHFGHVVGVDISPSMIQRAVSFARDNGIRNTTYRAINGPESFLHECGEFAGRCDFIYSLLVFQHIPDFSMIEGHLHVIRVLLHKHGTAYLQFDTRPCSAAYRLKTRLPDCLLPRFWRRGIRRIRRSVEQLEGALERAGLEIVEQQGTGTADHRYTLRIAPGRTEAK